MTSSPSLSPSPISISVSPMIPVFTGRKLALPPSTMKTPSFSWPFSGGAAWSGSAAWTAAGSITLPCLLISRTTTAWIGIASTLSLRAVVMSAVAFRPGRSEAGGSFRVTSTLKSFAWLAVLVLLVCCVVRPRGMADEPISVTSPLILIPSRASTRTSAGWPRRTLRMSVSSTMISTSMIDRSATVMITVGEKLWAPMTVSPSSFGRLASPPAE